MIVVWDFLLLKLGRIWIGRLLGYEELDGGFVFSVGKNIVR